MNFKNWYEGLSNFAYIPGGNIDDTDHKVLSKGKTKSLLEKQLAQSTGYNFNIIVGTFPGSPSKVAYLNKVIEYCKENNIPLENHITFAKSSSTGHPLTAWMLLHTIGHAILNQPNRSQVYRILDKILEKVSKIYTDEGSYVNDKAKYFKFKSALNTSANMKPTAKGDVPGIANKEEFAYELLAEYLWHGKIRIDPVYQHLALELEQLFDGLLKSCVGYIIMDYD